MSQMQNILDRAEQCHRDGMADDAFNALIDAIKLLSKAQQQVIRDIDKLRDADLYRTDVPMNAT